MMAEKQGYMLLFLMGLMASCEALTCRDGAAEHNGKCYKLYIDAKTFEDANTTCRAAPGSGYLITIDSADMQEFVKAQMLGGKVETVWMGARMQKTDWRWVQSDTYLKYQGCFEDKDDARLDVYVGSSANYTPDSCIVECRSRDLIYAGVKRDSKVGENVVCRCGNTYRPATYLNNPGCGVVCPSDGDQKCGNVDVMRIYNVESAGETGWHSIQPNNFQSYQACLAMHKGDHYKWGDEQCHGGMELYGYLCQYDSDASSCKHTYAAGKCYSVHGPSSSGESWYKARYLCKADGGDLLQVDAKEIFDFLKSGSAQLDPDVNRWWIGGTRVRWQWSNGEDMIFTNWAVDRPDSASKACAVVGKDVGQSYEWEDKRCSDVAAFICLQHELTTSTEPVMTATAPSTTEATAELQTTVTLATTTVSSTTTAAPTTTTTQVTTSTAKPTTTTTTTTTMTTTTKKPTTTKKTTTTQPPTTTTKLTMTEIEITVTPATNTVSSTTIAAAPTTTTTQATTSTTKPTTTTTTATTTTTKKPTTTTTKKPTTTTTTTTTQPPTSTTKLTTTTTQATTSTTKPITTTTTTTTTTTNKPTTTKKTMTTQSPTSIAKFTTEEDMTREGVDMTSSSPDAAEVTATKTVFTSWVIIGIILGSLFVLFVFVRLVSYCNDKSRRSQGDHDLETINTPDVDNQNKSETLNNYNNPEYVAYAYDTGEPLAWQQDVACSY